MYGDPDRINQTQWAPIIYNTTTRNAANYTTPVLCSVPQSMELQVMYTLQGSVSQPQNRIISARMVTTYDVIRYPCVHALCKPGAPSMYVYGAASGTA